ncbi:MAG: hypothetical protein EBR34_09140 [Sphingomonadaceae bacterium]|nr:hypothetical protein [Sphingomonadaceae bacterium]
MADDISVRPGGQFHQFNQSHPADRDAVAVAIAVCWFGLLSGFIPDMLYQYGRAHGYVPSAHVHAASAFGWMLLVSWQALKIRQGDPAAHGRNGHRFGPILAVILVSSALATVWTADRAAMAAPGSTFNPAKLAFQLGHIIPFGVLTAIALSRTDRPDLHKRLMLLAVFAILDTGWSRWLGRDLTVVLGKGPALEVLGRFPLTWALMAGMALYDRRTRGRIHPAFLPAAGLILVTQFGAAALYFAPWWPAVAVRILGG